MEESGASTREGIYCRTHKLDDKGEYYPSRNSYLNEDGYPASGALLGKPPEYSILPSYSVAHSDGRKAVPLSHHHELELPGLEPTAPPPDGEENVVISARPPAYSQYCSSSSYSRPTTTATANVEEDTSADCRINWNPERHSPGIQHSFLSDRHSYTSSSLSSFNDR